MNSVMKKLIILFTTNHADTLGNACRLDMVKYLVANFDTKIVTNQVEFIKGIFPKQEIIPIKLKRKSKIPLLNEFQYWKYFADKINSLSADGVFMFHDDSPATIWIKYPVFQYIHQYGKRGIDNKWSLKLFLKSQIEKVKHHFFLKGFNKSSQNFVVSTFLIDYFKIQGVKKLELIPHAMELSKFRNPVIDNNHQKLSELQKAGFFIIAYTGWVTENRGFQLMMDSIKKITKQNKKVVLVIAGADKYFSERIAEYQKKFQIQDNIINYGVVDASIIPGILHYANIGLSFWDANVPGYQLAPPQKIFEYFAAGKPVICNKIQTHSMFVENRKTGFVLNMDSSEVADTVLELINDTDFYQQMCINAANEAHKYDIDIVYGKMVKKINEVLDEYKN
jgi:glycosyltransferase involved in cell wall biosynthesis